MIYTHVLKGCLIHLSIAAGNDAIDGLAGHVLNTVVSAFYNFHVISFRPSAA